ncbi:DUF1963 domain-containing protein [Priestia aryabhattai]|uniref:DUF1963 domain-containing protein n=1 Tax=Priestia aryabhattai TaxID=412384 RepID=A0AAX6NCP4_PRIAR|nr:DUF1963 domain-containing protein [Priestia aryabhattai]MDU9693693.1 DUF1963 domain-containing protein [Priestia aryabhattai]
MSQNINLAELMKPIKKPSLNMLFLKYKNEEPNNESHLGGYPYFTNDDKWPTCSECKKEMIFFMQLREVTSDGNVVLRTYYQCSCELENFIPIINTIEYHNPSMEHCVKTQLGPKTLPFVEIKYEPSWSIPNWALLPLYNKEMHDQILTMHNDNNEQAEDYYESLRWNENYLATEPYSLISGYPEFISDPKVFKCQCCKKPTEFVFQLDTDEEFQISWNSGVLYCFRCPNTRTLYFTIN